MQMVRDQEIIIVKLRKRGKWEEDGFGLLWKQKEVDSEMMDRDRIKGIDWVKNVRE